jgi:hypothetical protein
MSVELMTAAEYRRVMQKDFYGHFRVRDSDDNKILAALLEREKLEELIGHHQGLRITDHHAICKEPGKGWFVRKRSWCGRESLSDAWKDIEPVVYYPKAIGAVRAVWKMEEKNDGHCGNQTEAGETAGDPGRCAGWMGVAVR